MKTHTNTPYDSKTRKEVRSIIRREMARDIPLELVAKELDMRGFRTPIGKVIDKKFVENQARSIFKSQKRVRRRKRRTKQEMAVVRVNNMVQPTALMKLVIEDKKLSSETKLSFIRDYLK